MILPSFVEQKKSLRLYNSWKVGGEAEYFCLPESDEQVVEVLHWCRNNQISWTVLGGGSNVLISDKGISGMVICLRNFSGFSSYEDNGYFYVRCKAGTPKFTIMRVFMKARLSPALFLSGLPGDMGGGVVMNAGVSEERIPREFREIIDQITVVDTGENFGAPRTVNSNQIKWNYRHSEDWQPGIITEVVCKWPIEPDYQIPFKVKEANQLRLSKQPLDLPSGGSTFVNPPGGISAGALIDQCGLKGFQIGGAQVSNKHANFIVNVENASAQDIAKIISHIKTTVKQKKSIDLETEIKWLGDWSGQL